MVGARDAAAVICRGRVATNFGCLAGIIRTQHHARSPHSHWTPPITQRYILPAAPSVLPTTSARQATGPVYMLAWSTRCALVIGALGRKSDAWPGGSSRRECSIAPVCGLLASPSQQITYQEKNNKKSPEFLVFMFGSESLLPLTLVVIPRQFTSPCIRYWVSPWLRPCCRWPGLWWGTGRARALSPPCRLETTRATSSSRSARPAETESDRARPANAARSTTGAEPPPTTAGPDARRSLAAAQGKKPPFPFLGTAKSNRN